MALDMTKLMPAAKAAFQKEMVENVSFVSDKCWDQNLRLYLEKFNKLLEAAGRMGVLEKVYLFTEEEIKAMEGDLRTLRALRMTSEAQDYIVGMLVDHWVSEDIFPPK